MTIAVFNEPFTGKMQAGGVLIIAGVLLVETGAANQNTTATALRSGRTTTGHGSLR